MKALVILTATMVACSSDGGSEGAPGVGGVAGEAGSAGGIGGASGGTAGAGGASGAGSGGTVPTGGAGGGGASGGTGGAAGTGGIDGGAATGGASGGTGGASNCLPGVPCVACGTGLSCKVVDVYNPFIDNQYNCCAGQHALGDTTVKNFCVDEKFQGKYDPCGSPMGYTGGVHVSCDTATLCPGGGKCCVIFSYKKIDEVRCGDKCDTAGRGALCDPSAPDCPADRICKPEPRLGSGFHVCQYK